MPDAAPDAPAAAATAPGAADPYRAYNFKLEVQGVTEAHFTECSGLGVKIDAIEYREAGNNQIVRRLPGRVHYGEVTFRFGLTANRDLWNWLQETATGRPFRRQVSIIMLSDDGNTEALRWNLRDAWPSQWRGAQLDALGREAAIESLTLVFDSLERA